MMTVSEKINIVNARKIDLLIKINEYFRLAQDPSETEVTMKADDALWENQAAGAAFEAAELPEFCLPSSFNQEFLCPATYPIKINDNCFRSC